MGTLCIILTVLITALVLAISQYNDTAINISIMFTDNTYVISFLVLTLMTYSIGILAGILLMLSSFFDASGRYSKLKKQYEKTSIGADEAGERIALLENKIKTLEEALNKALGN